jgi:hypothetical protein
VFAEHIFHFVHVSAHRAQMFKHNICRIVGHTRLCSKDRLLKIVASQSFATQNRKYRCAIGSTVAGSQVSSTPSARTS